jgi:hypothetical protein
VSDVIPERTAAEVDGGFVVLRIGLRTTTLRRIHRWLPTLLAMPRMLRELDADPDSGLLGHQTHLGGRRVTVPQYWRSFETLGSYARDPDAEHLPAWRRFVEEIGTDGDVGIWHETYLVRPDEYESVYADMPPFGPGAADGVELVPAAGDRETAGDRLDRTAGDGPPAEADSADCRSG